MLLMVGHTVLHGDKVNILGISGSIGWDGNWSMINDVDYWVHGSGSTLFVDGELIGGCDIALEMHNEGTLQNVFNK